MSFEGKTVIITGASRGIGYETVKLFYAAGARVYLTARTESNLNKLSKDLGGNAIAEVCDVGILGELERVTKKVLQDTGRIDILINNAGTIDPISNIHLTSPKAWSDAIDTNLKGVFYGVHAVLPTMINQKSGCIINLGSGAAYNPLEGWSHYCASKAGVAMLTKSLQLELKNQGIRVMSLSPGTVATEMQIKIKASGVNPISKLDVSAHVPAIWPAKTLLWMCNPDSEKYIDQEVSLRDPKVLKHVGLR